MKPLRAEDIIEGVVAYFDHEVLNVRKGVVRPPSLVTRTGPFLCIEADQERSCWTELTSRRGPDRLEIPIECRKGGSCRSREGPQFVNDPRSTYVAPHHVFVAAAAKEHRDTGYERPSISLETVAAILREVDDANGQRLDAMIVSGRTGLPVSTFRGSNPFRALALDADRQYGRRRPGEDASGSRPSGWRGEFDEREAAG